MKVVYRSLDSLKPFLKNPKKHPQSQIDKLIKSMATFGYTQPILINPDGMILAGHARYEAAKQIGLTEIATIELDITNEKSVAYVIADNRIAELAEEDDVLMRELIEQVTQIPDFDVEAIGFTVEEVDLMLGVSNLEDEEVAEEEAEEAAKEYMNIENDSIKIFHALAADQLGCLDYFHYLFAYSQGESSIVSPFPKHSTLFLDSGALSGVKKWGPDFVSLETQEKIVRYGEEMGVHWVTMLDIPMIPAVLEPLGMTKEEAYQIHIRNAKAFKNIRTEIRKVYVVQGPDFADFKRCCTDLQPLVTERDVVAIGSIKDRSGDTDLIVKITALVKSYFPHNDIHLFGITKPKTVAKCILLGATSCDSAAVSFATRTGSVTCLTKLEDGSMSTKSMGLGEYTGMGGSIKQTHEIRLGGTVFDMFNINLAILLEIQKQKAIQDAPTFEAKL